MSFRARLQTVPRADDHRAVRGFRVGTRTAANASALPERAAGGEAPACWLRRQRSSSGASTPCSPIILRFTLSRHRPDPRQRASGRIRHRVEIEAIFVFRPDRADDVDGAMILDLLPGVARLLRGPRCHGSRPRGGVVSGRAARSPAGASGSQFATTVTCSFWEGFGAGPEVVLRPRGEWSVSPRWRMRSIVRRRWPARAAVDRSAATARLGVASAAVGLMEPNVRPCIARCLFAQQYLDDQPALHLARRIPNAGVQGHSLVQSCISLPCV